MTILIKNHHDEQKVQLFIIPCSLSDKGERAGAGERAVITGRHFIIIYISSAWQGEGKISKNVTYRHTYIHFTIIYVAANLESQLV